MAVSSIISGQNLSRISSKTKYSTGNSESCCGVWRTLSCLIMSLCCPLTCIQNGQISCSIHLYGQSLKNNWTKSTEDYNIENLSIWHIPYIYQECRNISVRVSGWPMVTQINFLWTFVTLALHKSVKSWVLLLCVKGDNVSWRAVFPVRVDTLSKGAQCTGKQTWSHRKLSFL